MAQISFIKVNDTLSLPIKIFLNRKKIQNASLSSTVAINQKSIVKLNRINYLKLSIKDLNNLVDDIRDDLISHLLKRSLEDCFDNSKKGKISIDLNSGVWKCTLIVTIELLIELRNRLNMLTMTELQKIDDRKIKLSPVSKQDLRLLVKKLHFTFNENEDEKKNVDYNIQQMNLTNKLANCALLYVNIVPLS